MEPIIVGLTRIDETRHSAVVTQAQLRALVAEAVAKAAGLSLSASNVAVDQILFVFTDTHPGREVSVRCTLVEAHTRLTETRSLAVGGHALD